MHDAASAHASAEEPSEVLASGRLRAEFSRFLGANPERLHVAAHSHHPWPDVTFDAQMQAWRDAAELQDHKWERVFGEVLPEFRRHVARSLGLSDPTTIAVAPNTHEFVVRLLSAVPRPARILTTDAEFHSFDRQVRRLEEDGEVQVERVPAEPFDTFEDRLASAIAVGGHDLVFFSQVLFDSGYVMSDLARLVAAVADERTLVVIDGYHAYLALPTDLSEIDDRAFYLAGGYKYAMAGEGSAFMHCPPGYAARPSDTGWFAEFGTLESSGGHVAYSSSGDRFLGATFDPSGLYRANAVHRWMGEWRLDSQAIHAHVQELQRQFLLSGTQDPKRRRLTERLHPADLEADRGNFLTFRWERAGQTLAELMRRGVVADRRGDRLRLGFGCYHSSADVEELWRRLDSVVEGQRAFHRAQRATPRSGDPR